MTQISRPVRMPVRRPFRASSQCSGQWKVSTPAPVPDRMPASAYLSGVTMSALQITVDERNDATVIVLDGEIDIATENDFRDAVTSALEQRPGGCVVLDCAGLIDSSGLRVLVQSYKAAQEHRCQLRIAAPPERVAKILRVTAIDTRIPVHPTVEAALAAPAA
ncbi:anti-sigma factor antagonist [Thermobifida fusca YX]|nr:anti-sigma factor antagonist [Thermobifida fusca YX]